MDFKEISYNDTIYNLFGTEAKAIKEEANENEKFMIIHNNDDLKKSCILMDIFIDREFAEIKNFFSLDHIDMDTPSLRNSLISKEAGNEANIKKTMQDTLKFDIMHILLKTAYYYKCKIVFIYIDMKIKGYPICNDIYLPPHYLNWYGKNFGFIQDSNAKTYGKTGLVEFPDISSRQEIADELHENNRFYAKNKLLGPLKVTREYIVSRYYAYLHGNKKTPPSTKLEKCDGWMAKYMDPVLKFWLNYNGESFTVQNESNHGRIENNILYIE